MTARYSITIDIEPLLYERACELIEAEGMTVEKALAIVLERTAREGAMPLKKTRGRAARRKAPLAEAFLQGSLFEEDAGDGDEPEPTLTAAFTGEVVPLSEIVDEADEENKTEKSGEASEKTDGGENLPAPVTCTRAVATTASMRPRLRHPNLITLNALQESQAKLRWRDRERKAAPGDTTSPLYRAPEAPKHVIETPTFHKEKSRIHSSPKRNGLLARLNDVFEILASGGTPEGAEPVRGTIDTFWYDLGGELDHLGFIYEFNADEVCIIRFGTEDELFL